MRKFLLALLLLPALAHAQYYGPLYNPAAIAITGGTAAFTGTVSTTGNLNVKGIVSSADNTSPASVTNSGVAMNWAAPGGADIDLFDASQGANNRTGSILYYQGALRFRLYNDAHSAAAEPLTISGGQATGITGITSNSGSGTWAHTGNMNVSGTFNATGTLGSSANNAIPSPTNSGVTIGGGSNWANAQFYDQAASANNRTAAFNWSGGTFSFWFRSDAGTAITPFAISGGQGSGITGISLNSGTGAFDITGDTNITGTLAVSGQLVAGSGTLNVYSANGTSVTTPHMVTGTVTLASGAATATFTGNAIFSSATSYNCTANDTTTNAAVKVAAASASSISFEGATTDVIAYQCVGN